MVLLLVQKAFANFKAADVLTGNIKAAEQHRHAENSVDLFKSGMSSSDSGLVESVPAFGSLFPFTRYFELDSQVAGARFSAWVTPPVTYDVDTTQRFPAVYQVDGNLFFPSTAPFHQAGPKDVIHPLQPFILVSVGYSQIESQEWTWLRVRDLVPPSEKVPEIMRQTVEASVQAGQKTRKTGDRYLRLFDHPAGDKFLDFLERELHPLLENTFRIDSSDVGLWGDSYGGLFAAYVAVRRSDLFKTIGASSPGITGNDSRIFKLYQEAATAGRDYSGRRLHITIGAQELTAQGPYRWLTARGTADLLAETSLNPLKGLQVTAEVIPLESHLTGGVPAWFSFLRACYNAKGSV